MKKTLAIILSITSFILCACQASPKKPEGTSKDDREEEVKQTVEIISEGETEETEAITEETTTEYIDPQCTDPYNGMVVRPNPDQYIDPDIYYISFYYTEQQNNINFWMSTDIKGTTFSCSTGDGKSVDVVIDEEHAQQIFDELGKYKFYYWQTEDYQKVDENGVIAQINPPYTFYIYSSQFWNTTEIRLNEEDLQAFLTYVKTYCETIYESQQGG